MLEIGLGFIYTKDQDLVSYDVYNFITGNTVIGLSINGNNYYITDNNPITSDKVLNGYQVYTKGYQPITGTMPNNGDVTIAPTTSEQVKEKGYYNSLKVSAVTSAIDSNITPENIKKDVSILGVTGTLEEGIDTSDATATANDIAINKTAYVNGQKITGTLPLFPNTRTFTVSNAGVTNNTEDSTLDLTTINTTKQILDSNVSMNFNADYSDVATAIGLTADKIKAGETILGVEGTSPSGSLPYELVDLSALESGTSIIGFKVDLSVTPDHTKDYSGVSVVNSSAGQGLAYIAPYNSSDKLMVVGEDMSGSGTDLGCIGHIYEFTKTDETITGAKVVATQTYFIFTSPLTIDFISLNGIDLPIQAIKAL